MSTEAIPANNGIETSEVSRSSLADIHIAEYEVLANRITYYVTLQYGAWAVAAALFGYEAPLWMQYSDHRKLEWIGVVSILAVNWAVLHINYEFLLIVHYMESLLHERLANVAGTNPDGLLGFEGFIRQRSRLENFHRNIAPSLVFGAGTVALFGLLIVNVIYTHWSRLDWWWAAASGPLAFIVVLKAWQLSKLNGELAN